MVGQETGVKGGVRQELEQRGARYSVNQTYLLNQVLNVTKGISSVSYDWGSGI